MAERRTIGGVAVTVLSLVVFLTLCGCERGLGDKEAKAFLVDWKLAFNSHDLASFAQLYAEKGWFRVAPMILAVNSRTALRARMEKIWRRTPDLVITSISRVLDSGDRLACAWKASFTDPKTGGKAWLLGATFMRLRDGAIIEEESVFSRPLIPRQPRKRARGKDGATEPRS